MKQLPTIMVALNGARRTKVDHPSLPITVGEVVAEAAKCHAAGVNALHAHVRDVEGNHVLDAGLYQELIAEMAIKVPEMDVQITTEAVGIYSPEEQRKLVRDVMPKAVSVSLAEMLSDQDLDAAGDFYRFARDAGIAVQHILYSAEQVVQFNHCVSDGIIPVDSHQLLFVLGRYSEKQESDPSDLEPFLQKMDAGIGNLDWAVCAFGKQETACLLEAYRRGGKCRIGFENSLWNADGSVAKDNAERVQELSSLIRSEENHVI
ncbi:MAG: 3-keto-5-aminohexanoate cleavage protein [Rhizobiaceae bacterium]|nr:3-keto-5-aminohexanoate cleavage protein [Rhizobiaceae bacterium]